MILSMVIEETNVTKRLAAELSVAVAALYEFIEHLFEEAQRYTQELNKRNRRRAFWLALTTTIFGVLLGWLPFATQVSTLGLSTN